MPGAATLQNNSPRELALASIEEALTHIDPADQNTDEPKTRAAHKLLDEQARKANKRLPSIRISRSLVGVLALASIVLAVMVRQSNQGQAAPEPTSTSSVFVKKTEVPATPASTHDSDLAATAQERNLTPRLHGASQSAAPVSPELAHQIGDIARDIANVVQGVDQLKAEQSRMANENSELAEQLKATHELARHYAELTQDLKDTQIQMAREIGGLADQLKANQDVMTTISEQLRQGQEQVARLVAIEQKQRVARKPSASIPAAASVAGHSQDPKSLLQPKPQ